jgi:pilus assembly protein Flp/PilA
MKIPKREEGQGLVEYALLLVLVAIIIIAILTILGSQVMVVFARVTAGLNGQVITGQGVEAVVTSYDSNINSGTGGCQGSISNVKIIGLKNGGILKGDTVQFKVFADGAQQGSARTVTTDSSGNATYSGSIPISSTGSCNISFK